MGCNCGGSARTTEQVRQTQAELAARRQGASAGVFGEGYYFTGQEPVSAPPVKKTPIPAK